MSMTFSHRKNGESLPDIDTPKREHRTSQRG